MVMAIGKVHILLLDSGIYTYTFIFIPISIMYTAADQTAQILFIAAISIKHYIYIHCKKKMDKSLAFSYFILYHEMLVKQLFALQNLFVHLYIYI